MSQSPTSTLPPVAIWKRQIYRELLQPGLPRLDENGNEIIPEWRQKLDQSNQQRHQWRQTDE